jgi:dihydroxyacetone kinase-like predicted kinase
MNADLTHRYQVEYLIVDPIRPGPTVRRELASWLESEADAGAVAAAGDDTVIKVHLETARPAIALAIGRSAGTLADVVIEPRCLGASWERAA